MVRNIDLLTELQDRIRKFSFHKDEIELIMKTESKSVYDLIRSQNKELAMLIRTVNDVDKLLEMMTEDIKETMRGAGFDSDDYKVWIASLDHNIYKIDGLLETFAGALRTLELYVLEAVRGYRILTQSAYNINHCLPGLNVKADET